MADWPVDIRGVVESVVTTRGPENRWNVAALGLHEADADGPVTARTWGRTRTWRNFREEGGGYVQFTRDPVDFAEAALSIREEADPVLASADAWVRVEAARIDAGREGDTQWVEWGLTPVEARVVTETVPTTSRGFNAVVEATVAASRLDVAGYDRATLRERLAYFDRVARRCGDERVEQAIDRVRDLADAEW